MKPSFHPLPHPMPSGPPRPPLDRAAMRVVVKVPDGRGSGPHGRIERLIEPVHWHFDAIDEDSEPEHLLDAFDFTAGGVRTFSLRELFGEGWRMVEEAGVTT